MTKYSVILTVVCVFFTIISEISCIEELCRSRFEKCREDSDCCTKYCHTVGDENDKFCLNLIDDRQLFTEPFRKVQKGLCSYKKPSLKSDKENSNLMYDTYGINAGHSLLPSSTKVKVKINNKTVLLTINDVLPKSNITGTILELSEEAAKELEINNVTSIECSVEVWSPEPISYCPLILSSLTIVVFILSVLSAFS